MKKYLIAITMMLALGMNAQVAGQTHRHHNTASVTVPNDFVQQDEVEAFSDTTSAATGGDTVLSRTVGDRERNTRTRRGSRAHREWYYVERLRRA